MKIKRILVPIDFSPQSLQALDFAVDLAKPFRAALHVLLVIEPVAYVVPDYAGAQNAALVEVLEEQRRSGRAELARLGKRYAKRGVALRTLLQTGQPYQVIADEARRSKADLIVMATHGRTGLSRLLTGSVAERVVRTATCPVLTLHARAPVKRGSRRSR
jgi:nucleotide-binding universal stress UspA family protein